MRILESTFVILVLLATNLLVSHGFVSHQQASPLPSHSSTPAQHPNSAGIAIDSIFRHPQCFEQSVLVRHRRSVANVQMMGLFGLGTAEVVIILAAGAFIIGPEQLGKMVGSLKSDLPDDIKKIPEEFQKGLEESTENSRARNAKPMEPPPDEDVDEK